MHFYTERQFGRAVGGALLALAFWFAWRGRPLWVVTGVFAAATILIVLSFWAPATLRVPARLWMSLAHALGWVSTRIILAVVFFGIVTPVGLIRRALADPLGRRSRPRSSYWHPYSGRQRDPRHFERMY